MNINKQQYIKHLNNDLLDKDRKEIEQVKKTPLFKRLDKLKNDLRKELNNVDNQLDDIAGLYSKRHNKRNNTCHNFSNEWDEITLIIDNKKRKEAKEKLLKKYNLYR